MKYPVLRLFAGIGLLLCAGLTSGLPAIRTGRFHRDKKTRAKSCDVGNPVAAPKWNAFAAWLARHPEYRAAGELGLRL